MLPCSIMLCPITVNKQIRHSLASTDVCSNGANKSNHKKKQRLKGDDAFPYYTWEYIQLHAGKKRLTLADYSAKKRLPYKCTTWTRCFYNKDEIIMSPLPPNECVRPSSTSGNDLQWRARVGWAEKVVGFKITLFIVPYEPVNFEVLS